MTKLDVGLITPPPASDSGSAAAWGNKKINPRPQSCLCLTSSGYSSNDDDHGKVNKNKLVHAKTVKLTNNLTCNKTKNSLPIKKNKQLLSLKRKEIP